MRAFESAILAAALASSFEAKPMRRAPQRHGFVEPCPSDIMDRMSLATPRTAIVTSLWKDNGVCRVAPNYETAEAQAPVAAVRQGAPGLFQRLEAAGYVFEQIRSSMTPRVRITRLNPPAPKAAASTEAREQRAA